MIRKAVRLATLEKPGAVHIELPEDIAKLEIDAKPLESFPVGGQLQKILLFIKHTS